MDSDLLDVVVAGKAIEAEGIVRVELVAADGRALPAFTAGAHVEVHLPGGLVRPYSLCNDPAETHRYLLGVLREQAGRGGSAAMHDSVATGQRLRIGRPRNLFALLPGRHRSRLLAGGIGLTPLLAMAEQLGREGADFVLHHAVRSAAKLAFGERLRTAPWAERVRLHLDDGASAQRFDPAAAMAAPQPGEQAYVCGPQGFIEAVLAAARAAGWAEAQLHVERFGAAPLPTGGDRPFELQLARSGRVVPVAAGQTAVQALAAAGVPVMTSCEQGVCGTCLTRVLAGTPEHRDQYLLPEEQAAGDQFLPCCSRARTARLVVDL